MADIVVTEFMDENALAPARGRYAVALDKDLWNKPAELRAALASARAVIVRNRTQVTSKVIAAAPHLQVVGRLGVGLDNIDLPACQARGITVCPAIGANAVSVAEYVIGTAILLGRWQAFNVTQAIAAGQWPREAAGTGWELAGRRLGIVGFGSIGQIVAQRARAMGMSVAAHDDFVPEASVAWSRVERLSLDDLLSGCDVVSLHCPLTPQTKHLLAAPQLARMKKGAVLINAARGGVVVEADLAAALRSGHLGGAAMDVFEREPIDAASAAVFAGVPNLILSPHIAGVTDDSNARISTVTVANVLAVLDRTA
jgi:(S)-sulfolactate dehydrogenase